MIAALLLVGAVRAAEVNVAVGTGLTPLDFPGSGLFGGGARIGTRLLWFEPFVGGMLMTVSGGGRPESEDDWTWEGNATFWSATAGTRFRFYEGPPVLFATAGVLVIGGSGEIEDAVEIAAAPQVGFFGGVGADVDVVENVAVGLEVGVAHAGTEVGWENDGGSDEYGFAVTGTWVYSDLHVVVRFGGAR